MKGFFCCLKDAQYFSDSDHHLISTIGMSSNHRQDVRRMRNRTLTGLETMRLVDQLRPSSATGSRPITPSFYNDKDIGQQFIDFNPAGKKIFISFSFTLFASKQHQINGQLSLKPIFGNINGMEKSML